MIKTENRHQNTIRLVETALLLAISTLLSLPFLTLHSPWLMGGSVTFGSMLPIVLISHRRGVKWGMFSAFVLSLIQLILGINNITYAPNATYAIAIILLDYIIAFSVIGLSSIFKNIGRNKLLNILIGIVFSYFLRFVCHFLSGWLIWDALWPNEGGLAGWHYSLIYNISYMLLETLLALAICAVSYPMLKNLWEKQTQ
ncbi:MAG: energy-coupled thiamine transporter ThiT [Christensenellales bacterium]|jgi:thiamine transporter